MTRFAFATLTFFLCGGSSCNDGGGRSADQARIDAIRIMNALVICDGSSAAGWICGNNTGRLVWCPAKERDSCEAIPKPSVSPALPLPGSAAPEKAP